MEDRSEIVLGGRRQTLVPYVPDIFITLAVVAVVVGFIQIAVARGWISKLLVPEPSAVWLAFVDGFKSGVYWSDLWSTVSAALLGFGIGALAAIIIASFITAIAGVERVVMPLVVAFESIPKIAIAPIVLIWLGFDRTSKVVIVSLVVLFPVLISTAQGLRVRNQEQYELLIGLGATRRQYFRMVRLPSAIPYIFAGLQIGAIFSLLGAVIAEFVGAGTGLGYLMLTQESQFNIPGVWSVLLILMILGILIRQGMLLAERRVAYWTGSEISGNR